MLFLLFVQHCDSSCTRSYLWYHKYLSTPSHWYFPLWWVLCINVTMHQATIPFSGEYFLYLCSKWAKLQFFNVKSIYSIFLLTLPKVVIVLFNHKPFHLCFFWFKDPIFSWSVIDPNHSVVLNYTACEWLISDLKEPFNLRNGWLLWAGIGLSGAVIAVALTGFALSFFKGGNPEREVVTPPCKLIYCFCWLLKSWLILCRQMHLSVCCL